MQPNVNNQLDYSFLRKSFECVCTPGGLMPVKVEYSLGARRI